MALGVGYIPKERSWQLVGGLERERRAAAHFLQGGNCYGNEEESGYHEEAEEDRQVGEERVGLREEAGRESEGQEDPHEPGGQGGRDEGLAVEADSGCRPEATEGVYEDGRTVLCEDCEHAADKERDHDAAEGAVLLQQAEVPGNRRHGRVSGERVQPGDVQRGDERGELPQDCRGEEDHRRGRGDVRAGLQEACGREEGGEEPIHHGDRAGRTHAVDGRRDDPLRGRIPSYVVEVRFFIFTLEVAA